MKLKIAAIFEVLCAIIKAIDKLYKIFNYMF